MDTSCGTEEKLYSGLPPSVTSNASKIGLKADSKKRKDIVRGFLRRHLAANRLLNNEDNIGFAQIPLSNPTGKKKFNLSRPKRKKLLNKERKGNKVFAIPKQNQSYEQQMVIHQAWIQYMSEVIPESSLTSAGALNAACQKLIKADVQGAILTVQRSKCPSYIGTSGIVMQETRHMFTLISQDNRVKCIPKMNSVFALELHGHVFTIHGNHFMVKAGERSSKKFKSKPSVDL